MQLLPPTPTCSYNYGFPRPIVCTRLQYLFLLPHRSLCPTRSSSSRLFAFTGPCTFVFNPVCSQLPVDIFHILLFPPCFLPLAFAFFFSLASPLSFVVTVCSMNFRIFFCSRLRHPTLFLLTLETFFPYNAYYADAILPVSKMFLSCSWAFGVSCFAQTRAKTVLGFLHDIVLKTAERLHEASHLKKGDSFALITPFATATFNAEFRAASG